MWKANSLFVISDIHLGPEYDTGFFQADDPLAGFLIWLNNRDGPPVTLIINGDFLDFLVPAYKGEAVPLFDPATAADRAALILDSHPRLVGSLAEFANSGHRLIILCGNHDPELILPSVQNEIESRLESPVRWLVHGEAARFRIGGAEVLIEHGDLFDDWNRIDRNKLRRALDRVSRGFVREHGFATPPGSRLVVNFLTELRYTYPWIDYLKPEREAVVPILNHFLPLKRKAHLRKALGPWLRQKLSALKTLGLNIAPTHALVRARNDEVSKSKRLLELVEGWSQSARQRVHEVDRQTLIQELRDVSAEDGYFDPGHPDTAAPEVARILDHGTDLIVHGHTHAAKAYGLGERGLYLNSGTWGQLLELPAADAPEEAWNDFLDALEEGRASGTRRLTFVEIFKGKRAGIQARLLTWDKSRPHVLSGFRSAGRGEPWEKEDQDADS